MATIRQKNNGHLQIVLCRGNSENQPNGNNCPFFPFDNHNNGTTNKLTPFVHDMTPLVFEPGVNCTNVLPAALATVD
jgi:hypothetical protein